MAHLIQFLFSLIASSARTRPSLQIEVAALRHQLSVYRVKRRKPRISSSDRLLWSLLSKWWCARRKTNWARLIRKVYEVDPLKCLYCGATLRIIALIDDARFLRGFLYLTNVRSWPKPAVQIAGK